MNTGFSPYVQHVSALQRFTFYDTATFLNVVGRGAPIFQLLPGKDRPLLVRGGALFVLGLGLDILDGLHEDLHCQVPFAVVR